MAERAYIFDLDGTLLDSDVLWVEAVDRFLRGRGAVLARDTVTAIVYGKSWRDVHRDVTRLVPGLNMSLEQLEEELGPIFYGLRDAADIRIHTSIDLLRRLAAGHPVCIVSGSLRKDVAHAVEMMGIGAMLRFYLGAEDYGLGKPDPACYLLAAEKLGCRPAQCVVFEDSQAGVRAAKAAGMVCVALARNGAPPQDLSPADAVLADLGEFREELLTRGK